MRSKEPHVSIKMTIEGGYIWLAPKTLTKPQSTGPFQKAKVAKANFGKYEGRTCVGISGDQITTFLFFTNPLGNLEHDFYRLNKAFQQAGKTLASQARY